MAKKPKRPRDTNQLAKFIIDLATGEIEPPKTDEGKDAAAVSLGRRGGLKGGKARAKKLTPEQRSSIAREAANARWRNEKQPHQQREGDEPSERQPRRRVLKTPRGT